MSHTKDVLSVAFSADNRQIVSGSRDKSIKLWNTLAQCKYTITVSCSFLAEENDMQSVTPRTRTRDRLDKHRQSP